MTMTAERPGVLSGGEYDESPYVTQFRRVITNQLGYCDDEPQGSQHVFICPFDCAVQGYRKKRLYVNIKNGCWCCYHCNFAIPGKQYREDAKIQHGGTAWEFAEYFRDDHRLWPRRGQLDAATFRQQRKVPTEAIRRIWWRLFERAELRPEDAETMVARGIDPVWAQMKSTGEALFEGMTREFGQEQMLDAGLARLYDNHGRERYTWSLCLQPGRILLPYRTTTGCRFFIGYARTPERRPHQSDAEYACVKERWVKAPGPADFGTQLYGHVPHHAPYVVVTEGQLKAEAARQRGFPCVGLTGMNSQHREFTEEVLRQRARRVIILFDEQDEDSEAVDFYAENLARELLRRHVPTWRARLPLHPTQGKMDVDEFFVHHTTDEFLGVLEAAQPCYLHRLSG